MLLAAFAFTSTSHAVDYTWDPTMLVTAELLPRALAIGTPTTTNWTTTVGATNERWNCASGSI